MSFRNCSRRTPGVLRRLLFFALLVFSAGFGQAGLPGQFGSARGRGPASGTVSANSEAAVVDFLKKKPLQLLAIEPQLVLKAVHSPTPQPGQYVFEFYLDGARVHGINAIADVDSSLEIRVRERYPEPLAFVRQAGSAGLLLPADVRKKALSAVGGRAANVATAAIEDVWVHSDQGFRRGRWLTFASDDGAHQWDVVIDARTGATLLMRDRLHPEGVRPGGR
ncbi:MAG: hypothetical protein ABI051_15055 [Vicinamibacterales bacterium]